jgi:hypothetical protein
MLYDKSDIDEPKPASIGLETLGFSSHEGPFHHLAIVERGKYGRADFGFQKQLP